MKALITGAGGFVGTALVAHLTEAGDEGGPDKAACPGDERLHRCSSATLIARR